MVGLAVTRSRIRICLGGVKQQPDDSLHYSGQCIRAELGYNHLRVDVLEEAPILILDVHLLVLRHTQDIMSIVALPMIVSMDVGRSKSTRLKRDKARCGIQRTETERF